MIIKLDENFNPLGVLENYESMIWHEKYFECGAFEFHAPYSLGNALYIYDNQTDLTGIIESLEKEKMKHKYSGRLLKALLDNKIISYTCTYTNKSTEYIVKDLVTRFAGQNIEVEPNEDRGLVIDTLQVTGDNLMEYTDELLMGSELGGKIDFDYLTGKLTYKVYEGIDNSNKMPMSTDFENIYGFTYTNNRQDFKNYAYVDGENASQQRVRVEVDRRIGNEEKREIYVDARDIQSQYTDENNKQVTLTDAEYKQALIQRGNEKLDEYQIQETIEIEPKEYFEIGEKRTFRDGNLVSTQRITERIMAYEANQIKQTVTFGLQILDKSDKIKREVK